MYEDGHRKSKHGIAHVTPIVTWCHGNGQVRYCHTLLTDLEGRYLGPGYSVPRNQLPLLADFPRTSLQPFHSFLYKPPGTGGSPAQ